MTSLGGVAVDAAAWEADVIYSGTQKCLSAPPGLAPIALSLYGIAGVWRRGLTRDYAIAGIGLGLAAATKYTGGAMLLCLLLAAVCDGIGGAPRTAAGRRRAIRVS